MSQYTRMPQRSRLTNNSDETDIGSLIAGDNIFSIPYFQRSYKWKQERLNQLNADIRNIIDEPSEVHFLGAVIVHGRRSNPSDPDIFEVIDGQQRITTLFIYLCAIVRVFCQKGDYDSAIGAFQKYLVISRNTGVQSNIKLHSSKDDRLQLALVFEDILSDAKFVARLSGFELKPLPKTGKETGQLIKNYRSALRFLNDEFEQGEMQRLKDIYATLLNRMSVVQIDVWDPTNGPKIFDSLNSRQEPMTIGDLVRNEIFSRISNAQSNEIEYIDANYWQPFYKKFDQGGKNLFDGYFFPYGLIKRPNVVKAEVYSNLRDEWASQDDPKMIIHELAEYQNAFIDLQCGTNYCGFNHAVSGPINKLHQAKLPSSTLPFLMQLLHQCEKEKISDPHTIEIVSLVESFLIRRVINGIEPTGLHAVFKRLWSDCEGEITANRVAKEIAKHKTVAWPTNEEFRTAIQTRSIYGTSVDKYVILEYDRSLKGDTPNNLPWIEHILPLHPEEGWFHDFTRETHDRLKNRLANLLPLSKEMNIELSNKPYLFKKTTYLEDSMFKSARDLASSYEFWTPKEIEMRGKHLADWAISRWPHIRPA